MSAQPDARRTLAAAAFDRANETACATEALVVDAAVAWMHARGSNRVRADRHLRRMIKLHERTNRLASATETLFDEMQEET